MLVKRVDANLRNCNGTEHQLTVTNLITSTQPSYTHTHLTALFSIIMVHNSSNGSLKERGRTFAILTDNTT